MNLNFVNDSDRMLQIVSVIEVITNVDMVCPYCKKLIVVGFKCILAIEIGNNDGARFFVYCDHVCVNAEKEYRNDYHRKIDRVAKLYK